MAFPRDLDIFSALPVSELRTVRNPCAKTCSGSASPMAMSIAGQITQWKRMMSFPTTWYWAGQRRAYSSAMSGLPNPTAVA